ncbi:uncharacterized protein L3040_001838 [Drepanopeziza brunnea f. sp. 'multigermtubi']|uniref:uncharacterized protein n=1 Tax=Drepanopeziza brunnea f. sp. 'multigermtubi' TaxID=698441 RepID=UPI0023820A28|nr:hypothetical protein L3040_001838 [Drepanopeziza brunnea f. sp. 'multigermtubi']
MSSHVEYRRYRRDESCTEEGCRAREYYVEDGKKFCRRGHEQFGFTQVEQGEDEWNTEGKKSRSKKEKKERAETVLSGSEAKELYLQCYQLILWKQCHWLVTSRGLPEELQVVVKDLWELRTRVIHISRDDRSGYGSGTGTMMFSSQSEGETTDTDATTRRGHGSRRRRKGLGTEELLPTLIETLGLCYLGILLLKMPLGLGDIYKWATQDGIPYNRAIKEVPRDMRSKLPAHYHSALEIRAPLRGSALYDSVSELIDFYNSEFEMSFPSLNAPLLIFRYLRDLCLPVEIYAAVRRLATLLEIDFSYPAQRRKSYRFNAYPEIQLASLVVIATKLAHPFDNITRAPESYSDPSAVRIDWARWTKATATNEPQKGFKRGDEIMVTDTDVWNMNAEKLDDYLDWYQNTWIDDREQKFPGQILQLFPLDDISPRPVEEDTETERQVARLKAVQRSLICQSPHTIDENEDVEGIRRAGELYKRFRTEDELPGPARLFFQLAASKAGITLRMLVKYVFRLEVKLENLRLGERRREAAKSD